MSHNSMKLEDLSSDTLRDLVVKCRTIIHTRRVAMASTEDMAKRTDIHDEIRKDHLRTKYDELTDMIVKVGKSNAGEYIHERAKIAETLYNDFGIIRDETRHRANPVDANDPNSIAYSLRDAAQKDVDMVNHPPHYTTGSIEVIDFIDDKQLGFYEGQVIKYVSRAKLKNNGANEVEDLKKAQWYLNRLIEKLEGKKENAIDR